MRQFVAECAPDKKGRILVEGKKTKHLISVLRCSVGDMVTVRLPSGILQPMTVAYIDDTKKTVWLQIAGEKVENSAIGVEHKGVDLWLFQFAAKPPKMDLIIRQAVECGVSTIVPVAGTFCQSGSVESAKKKSKGTDERWELIITEAREQSGSPVCTKVLPCVTLQQALVMWKKHVTKDKALAFVLYEQSEGTVSLFSALKKTKLSDVQKAALIVGAEGGISSEEMEYLKQNGVIAIHFATNILRCETAALYGIAALQNVLVEKEIWQFKE